MAAGDNVALPSLAFFEKPDLFRYVEDESKWPELESALSHFQGFYVINALTQQHQAKICRLMDGTVHKMFGDGIIHCLAYKRRHDDAKAALLVRRLLQIGAHPDLGAQFSTWTPSHLCADRGSVKIAQSLIVCRPNLRLRDNGGDIPAARARKKKNLDVAIIFENAEDDGFPIIAQLTQERKWWAVHNLCRRGIVPKQEKFALHNGKDAIGWAVQHKEFAIAEELEYLLKGVVAQPAVLRNAEVEEKLAMLKADLEKVYAAKEAVLEQKLQEQAGNLEQLKLDQKMLKQEGDQLKEMVLLNLTKTSEECQDLKKELLKALNQKHSKLKDNLQGKLDHQAEELKQLKIDCKLGVTSQKATDSGQAAQAVPNAASMSAVGGNDAEKIARLEAENKALREKVDYVLKAQSALLTSLMKAEL